MGLGLLLWINGCTQNYDVGNNLKDSFSPKVVVNSVICPDSLIRVKCYWSRRYDDAGGFRAVESFSGELLEDGKRVAAFDNASEEVLIDYRPVAGRKYGLTINVPDYGMVTASTYIPLLPTAVISFKESRREFLWYHHFNVSAISQQEPGRAVWIICYEEYDDGSALSRSSELYCNNVFIDQINGVRDDMDVIARGSNIGYEKFIRITSKNIDMASDISFSIWASPGYTDYSDWEDPQYDENGYPIYKYVYLKYLYVNVIAPSDDYDKYYRSLYKQELYNYDPDMPLFDETVNVYSNIENGLGIFAGYSATTYAHKYEMEETE